MPGNEAFFDAPASHVVTVVAIGTILIGIAVGVFATLLALRLSTHSQMRAMRQQRAERGEGAGFLSLSHGKVSVEGLAVNQGSEERRSGDEIHHQGHEFHSATDDVIGYSPSRGYNSNTSNAYCNRGDDLIMGDEELSSASKRSKLIDNDRKGVEAASLAAGAGFAASILSKMSQRHLRSGKYQYEPVSNRRHDEVSVSRGPPSVTYSSELDPRFSVAGKYYQRSACWQAQGAVGDGRDNIMMERVRSDPTLARFAPRYTGLPVTGTGTGTDTNTSTRGAGSRAGSRADSSTGTRAGTRADSSTGTRAGARARARATGTGAAVTDDIIDIDERTDGRSRSTSDLLSSPERTRAASLSPTAHNRRRSSSFVASNSAHPLSYHCQYPDLDEPTNRFQLESSTCDCDMMHGI